MSNLSIVGQMRPGKKNVYGALFWCLTVCLFLLPSLVFAETIHYAYDTMGRIISMEGENEKIFHGYDALGNRLVRTAFSASSPNRPPRLPASPSPAHQVTEVDLSTLLQWTGGDDDPDDRVTYSVFFGTTENPPLLISGLTATRFQLPPLLSRTTYHWKVVAQDSQNSMASSPLWTFTTGNKAPQISENVSPGGATEVYYGSAYLSWQAVDPDGDSVRYDVYLGTSPESLERIASIVDVTQLSLGALSSGTAYYWKVVATDRPGETTETPVYQFSTGDHEPVRLANVTLSSDRTLSKEEGPYIVSGTMTVNSGVTLTIEPGTLIKFETSALLRVNGKLLASGTEADKIVFTSSRNDLAGGDTNKDLWQTIPAPGDWTGIQFLTAESSDSVMQYCDVAYAGYSSYSYGSIYISAASPTLQHTTIQQSKNPGIYIASGSPMILNARIQDNLGVGIHVNNGQAQILNSVFEGQGGNDITTSTSSAPVVSGNTFSGNITLPVNSLGAVNQFSDNTAVISTPGGTLSKDITLPDVGVPYRFTGSVTVLGTDGEDGITTLTITPGARLEFAPNTGLVIGSTSSSRAPGALVAKGTAEAPIVFTSSQASPAPGNWYGIQLLNTAAATSVMEHCEVAYAGSSSSYGAVYVVGSSPTLQNTTILQSKNQGIYIASGSPRVLNAHIQDNLGVGIHVNGGQAQILNSVFEGQGGNDITASNSSAPIVSGNTFSGNITLPVNSLGAVNQFSDNTAVISVSGGTLSKDITLPDVGVPYRFTGSVTVLGTDGEDGITTLTIGPGARLEFAANTVLDIGSTSSSGAPGALVARGTVEAPIIFTSSQTSPAPGNWYGIRFLNTSAATSVMEHCEVSYAGYNSNYGAVYVVDSSPTIDHTTIRDSSTHGIYVYSGSPQILNSVFENQGGNDITASNSSAPVVSGNTFSKTIVLPIGGLGFVNHFSDSTAVISVSGGTLSKDMTLPDSGAPYRFTRSVTVLGTDGEDGITTLTIGPGARLEFAANTVLDIGSTSSSGAPGALVARGTVEAPIIFTSSQTSPAPGNWYGIRFLNTSAATSVMEHCEVSYAGYNSYGAVYVVGVSPTIVHTTIRDSSTYGVYVYSGDPIVNFSKIYGNLQYGIYKRSGPMMDARYNWWGHDSGPLDTSDDSASGGLYNPTGQGDRVTNYVNYMPWTTSDPGADEDSIADDLALIYGMDPFALDSGGRIPGGEEPLFQGMGWSSNPPETPSPPIIYASGDETVLSAWDIFDNDPSGAQILRVYDAELGKTAIQLDGNGIENGYRLRNTDGTWWNNTEHPVIQWRIKASEPFVVYVVIQTTEGLRYLQYTPGEGDVVDMGTGIEHKLGSTGSGWYTFARDLDLDLAAGQPDSAFEAVMGFLVRGTCLVDDVRTLAEIPVDHDTDGDGYADAVEISAGTDPMDPASHP